MDGYTVEEAASVLGVPRERIWELLARGIITGSADLGGAMRVRLKAEPAAVQAAPVEGPADAGYGAAAELTPFRELLTEFRSLTERYGQALLALGEARGEVAALRSRVDMLEARVDLRLPSSAAPISSSWSSTPWPTPTERVIQPPPAKVAVEAAPAEEGATIADHAEAEAPPVHDDEAGSHRRRGRTARRATDRFADALARAEDPSLPELPGAAETAAALAALRREHPPEAARAPESDTPDREADASLPRELPSADHVPVAEEEEPLPDTVAAATLEVATREDDDADVEPAQARVSSVGPDVEAEPQAEPQPRAEVEPTRVAATVEERPVSGDEAESDVAWDPERYSAAIEEPGWISADETDAPAADAPAAWVPPHQPSPPMAWSAPPEAEAQADAAPPPPPEAEAQADAGPQEREESREDGSPAVAPAWRRSPAGAMSERSTAIPIESSGSRELDEGLAALDALANPKPSVTDAAEDAEPAEGGDGWTSGMERTPQPVGAPRPQAWSRPSPAPQLATRSSASRAYRRLRRIFPT